MTDYSSLKAGPELDRLVGEKIMGCRVKRWRHPRGNFLYDLVVPGGVNSVDWVEEVGAWSGMPRYSTEIAHAWRVVEKVGLAIHPTVVKGEPWRSATSEGTTYGRHPKLAWNVTHPEDCLWVFATDRSPALAICLGALRAIDEFKRENS